MTSPRWNLWRAGEPSADFADRVVAELVRDGRRRRVRRRRPSRFVVVAFAAVMVAGGAWGYANLSARSVQRHAPAGPAVTATQPATRAATASPLAPPTAPPAPPAPAAAPRRKVEAPPPPPSAAPAGVVPDAGRKVILPHCNCSPNESICDCF